MAEDGHNDDDWDARGQQQSGDRVPHVVNADSWNLGGQDKRQENVMAPARIEKCSPVAFIGEQ